MTCIVAYKDADGIYIAGDKLGSADNTISVRKKAKVFKKSYVKEVEPMTGSKVQVKSEMGFGICGSFRMCDVIQHMFRPPNYTDKMDEEKYMVKLFIPALLKCFADNSWLYKNNELPRGGTFIVGFNGRLFTIHGDFQVSEQEGNYIAIGCGDDHAKGAMYIMTNRLKDENDLDPEQIVESAIKASIAHSAFVGGGVDVITIEG